MPQPVFKGSAQYPVLPWRDWLRKVIPPGKAGFVVEDVDLVLLRFGPAAGRPYEADGKFMLIEIKERSNSLSYAQQRTYGLLHKLCRQADPNQQHYIGCYLWNWEGNRINGQKFSEEEIRDFLIGKKHIPSLFDGEEMP